MAGEGPSGGQLAGGLGREDTGMQVATARAEGVLTRGREGDSEWEGRGCGPDPHGIKQWGHGACRENAEGRKRPLPTSFRCYSRDFGPGLRLSFSLGALTRQPPYLRRLPSSCDAPFMKTESRFFLATHGKKESKSERIYSSLSLRTYPW